MTDNEIYFVAAWSFYLLVGFYIAIAIIRANRYSLPQVLTVFLLWPLFLLIAGLAPWWQAAQGPQLVEQVIINSNSIGSSNERVRKTEQCNAAAATKENT